MRTIEERARAALNMLSLHWPKCDFENGTAAAAAIAAEFADLADAESRLTAVRALCEPWVLEDGQRRQLSVVVASGFIAGDSILSDPKEPKE